MMHLRDDTQKDGVKIAQADHYRVVKVLENMIGPSLRENQDVVEPRLQYQLIIQFELGTKCKLHAFTSLAYSGISFIPPEIELRVHLALVSLSEALR